MASGRLRTTAKTILQSAHSSFLSKRQARNQHLTACVLSPIALASQLCDCKQVILLPRTSSAKLGPIMTPSSRTLNVSPRSWHVPAAFAAASVQPPSVHKMNLFLSSLIPHLWLPNLLLALLNTSSSYKRLVEAWNYPVQCLSVLSLYPKKIQLFFSLKLTFLSMTESSIPPASDNWKSHDRQSVTKVLPF